MLWYSCGVACSATALPKLKGASDGWQRQCRAAQHSPVKQRAQIDILFFAGVVLLQSLLQQQLELPDAADERSHRAPIMLHRHAVIEGGGGGGR